MEINKTTSLQPNDGKKYLTKQTAQLLHHAPQSLRAALHRSGHFLGMRPVRLPNGRLLWDAAAVHKLMNGEVV